MNETGLDYDRYDPRGEAARIRHAITTRLTPRGDYDWIAFEAYSREERDAIAALLTPEERKRVYFLWMEWGNGSTDR